MFCTKCGAAVKEQFKYCTHCGNQIKKQALSEENRVLSELAAAWSEAKARSLKIGRDSQGRVSLGGWLILIGIHTIIWTITGVYNTYDSYILISEIKNTSLVSMNHLSGL